MKKIENSLFTFILGAFLFGGIGFVVAKEIISSDSVTYLKDDGTPLTASQAIDELYGLRIAGSSSYNYLANNDIEETWSGVIYTSGITTSKFGLRHGIYLLILNGRDTNTLSSVSLASTTTAPIITKKIVNPTQNTAIYVLSVNDRSEIEITKNNSYQSIAYGIIKLSEDPNYDYNSIVDLDNTNHTTFALETPRSQTLNLTPGKYLIIKPTGCISGRNPSSNSITTNGTMIAYSNNLRSLYFNTAIVESDSDFSVTTTWSTSYNNDEPQPNITLAIPIK